ncbi:C4-dicarboxylate ABC transporter substrate-binding protein [Natronospirillum operosum]|uniref:C4-dicarboxylate ABC transporter substrate-binding protein n=1 Tax=Natronospirillum operosum TaxID=2759953 RepID=A0A4Z0W7D9_9GAMM|nr:C4-dicarboxylate TRAP transporter substrate-binding protein [Natronospirillum operosum]TGG90612.1 C4-dicarboxylate ABC transporter substrate-binding protein [Natronospirillum operosum]
MYKSSITRITLAAAAAFALLSGIASAQELRLTPGLPPAHPGHTPLFTVFQEQLEERSNGELSGQILGTEVANIGNMRNAITSGLSDAGMFLPAYFPSDLPNINLVGDLSFMGNNPMAMAAAMTEYVVTCDDCQAELQRLGVVYTSSHSSDIYHLLTTEPVESPDDLRGLRLRVGGPHYARWVESMGGSPSNTSVGETFEAISQGVLDGTLTSTSDMISFRLDDVVDYVTTLPLGTYHSTISHTFNNRTWNNLTPEQRRIVAESSSYASTMATQRWGYELPEIATSNALDKGIEFLDPTPELIEASERFIAGDLDSIPGRAEGEDGLTDASAKVARFQVLVNKWEDIAESVDNDPAAVAEAMSREIWDEVDFATYGL